MVIIYDKFERIQIKNKHKIHINKILYYTQAHYQINNSKN